MSFARTRESKTETDVSSWTCVQKCEYEIRKKSPKRAADTILEKVTFLHTIASHFYTAFDFPGSARRHLALSSMGSERGSLRKRNCGASATDGKNEPAPRRRTRTSVENERRWDFRSRLIGLREILQQSRIASI